MDIFRPQCTSLEKDLLKRRKVGSGILAEAQLFDL